MWRSNKPINTLFIYVRIYWSLRLVAIVELHKNKNQPKYIHTNAEKKIQSAKSGDAIVGKQPHVRIMRELQKMKKKKNCAHIIDARTNIVAAMRRRC